jgi:hypothetical protein
MKRGLIKALWGSPLLLKGYNIMPKTSKKEKAGQVKTEVSLTSHILDAVKATGAFKRNTYLGLSNYLRMRAPVTIPDLYGSLQELVHKGFLARYRHADTTVTYVTTGQSYHAAPRVV